MNTIEYAASLKKDLTITNNYAMIVLCDIMASVKDQSNANVIRNALKQFGNDVRFERDIVYIRVRKDDGFTNAFLTYASIEKILETKDVLDEDDYEKRLHEAMLETIETEGSWLFEEDPPNDFHKKVYDWLLANELISDVINRELIAKALDALGIEYYKEAV